MEAFALIINNMNILKRLLEKRNIKDISELDGEEKKTYEVWQEVLQKEELLIERDFGVMTGKKVSEIEIMCAPNIIKTDHTTYFLNPDGAETFPDLLKRAELLLEKINNKHASGNVLLVCHGDIGKMIYSKYYNLKWETVLTQFHFGNCDLLLLSEDSPAEESHVFNLN